MIIGISIQNIFIEFTKNNSNSRDYDYHICKTAKFLSFNLVNKYLFINFFYYTFKITLSKSFHTRLQHNFQVNKGRMSTESQNTPINVSNNADTSQPSATKTLAVGNNIDSKQTTVVKTPTQSENRKSHSGGDSTTSSSLLS